MRSLTEPNGPAPLKLKNVKGVWCVLVEITVKQLHLLNLTSNINRIYITETTEKLFQGYRELRVSFIK